MTEINYNIAIIGQTGVGKSSLINYLFGDYVAKAGIGKPFTTNGFYEFTHNIKGMSVKIYDSWGVEANKEKEWQKALDEELKKRGIDKPASDWFHSVFYCISAGNARIQEIDCQIIKKLISKNYKVSIVLTKADALLDSKVKLEKFINVIAEELGNDIAIIPVCSVYGETRGGDIFQFGKEEVEKQSLLDLMDSLINRIPLHLKSVMKEKLNNKSQSLHNYIDEKISFFGFNSLLRKEISEATDNMMYEVMNTGGSALKKALEQYVFIHERIRQTIGNESYNDNYRWEAQYFNFIKLIGDGGWIVNMIFSPSAAELHQNVDRASEKIKKIIEKNVHSLSQSLQSVKYDIDGDKHDNENAIYTVDFILVGGVH